MIIFVSLSTTFNASIIFEAADTVVDNCQTTIAKFNKVKLVQIHDILRNWLEPETKLENQFKIAQFYVAVVAC
jgi:hypothetical protein